jgi:hypothetical protein
MTLYKWLNGSRSTHGGSGGWRKGRWRSVRGLLVPCENGLHLCREQDLLSWVAPTLWVAEHDGELVDAGDKVVVRRARVVERLNGWNDRTARLFAADCAERALPLFEKERTDDDRSRWAIEASRDYANGKIGAAAWAAARDAARDAAWAAARAAAWAAARDAAWAAEREWQTAQLLDYAHGRIA